MFKSKIAKIVLFSALALVAVALIGRAFWQSSMGNTGSDSVIGEEQLMYTNVSEGSIASSTLLSGTVEAADEQYVYYDPSKGDISEVKVQQGDQVQPGQALVQYDTAELQANYDTAVRARDKIGRQIYDLETNGQTVNLTGDETLDGETVEATQRTVDMQLQDLNDEYADAQATVDKAQEALNEATLTSTVAGTVVEVNQSISKSNTTTSQTVVHIVNQGSLQVTGNLSEYDLANISVDQEVILTSKVYPDKTWSGKISYVSNYPENQSTGDAAGATSGGAQYPFKVKLTSEVGELRQGFTVNIEVVNKSKSILVPISAVVAEGDKSFVWTIVGGSAKKVEVILGSADATQQEVITGLKAGDQVISNPDDSLEDGKEVDAYEEVTD